MKLSSLALVALVFLATPVAAAPPVARVSPVTDIYFGETVSDPYRWMEGGGAAFTDWAAAQDAVTRSELSALPGYAALAGSVAAMSAAVEPVGWVSRVGDNIFYQRRPAGAQQNRLFVKSLKTGVEQELFDPTSGPGGALASIAYYAPSPDGSLVAIGVADSGSEEAVLRILRVRDRTFLPDRIDRARFGSPSWDPDGRSFYYGRLRLTAPDADPATRFSDMRILRHRLGDDPDHDAQVFRIGDQSSDVGVDGATAITISNDGRYAFAIANAGVSPFGEWWVTPIVDLRAGKPAWRKIGSLADQLVQVSGSGNGIPPWVTGGKAIFLSTRDAPRGKLVRVDLTRPDRPIETVLPEGETVLTQFIGAADGLYLLRTGAGGGLSRMDLRTGGVTPVNGSGSGAIVELATDPKRSGIVFSLETWTRPATLQLSDGEGAPKPLMLGRAFPADLSMIVSEETTVRAADGVAIPVSIIRRSDLKRDGSAPGLFEAYGAYGIPIDPTFNARLLPWLMRGGVYVVVHVRGGGELGETWHLAGMQATKPNTWRDMIAAIESLEGQGYVARGRIAVTGTSAGGVMVGRVLTERPDLLAAAIMNVPVADTLRFELTEGGPSNVVEFGTVTTEPGYRALRMMSPYANVIDGTRYPAVMVTAGVNDHRVPAWMPAKMAARLQAASVGDAPVRFRVEFDAGHGVGSSKGQRDGLLTDTLAFILRAVGDPAFQPAP